MKELYIKTKKDIYRTSAITFLILLFGALGAGFINVVQVLFNQPHLLAGISSDFEKTFLFLMFWATDFFFIGFTTVLCYKISGLPAIAPALTLSVYFAHFAGDNPISAVEAYHAYFATPANYGGGVNIGYMGYFIMAICLAVLIKLGYIGWDKIKESGGKKLNGTVNKLMAKFKQPQSDRAGVTLLENLDLIVLILIIPAVSSILTWLAVQYGIQHPFNALGKMLSGSLSDLFNSNIILAAVLMGLMVGFDIIGPVSMSAFGVAAAAVLDGNARPMTIFCACFVCMGWIPIFDFMWNKLLKIGGKRDTDDFNIAMSGPINAFFDNIKLTVAFTMPYAYKSPLTVIPGCMAGGAAAGLLTALFKLSNDVYLSSVPQRGAELTMAELFKMGERYISFSLPLRTGEWFSLRIPLALTVLAGGIIGGLIVTLLRQVERKISEKNGTYVETDCDIVKEMRITASEWAAKKH